MVHEDTAVPRVTATRRLVRLGAADLEDGMIYQFRVVSFADTTEGRTYRAATEDLRGVFMFEGPRRRTAIARLRATRDP